MKICSYCYHPLARHTAWQKADCKASLRSQNKYKKKMGLPTVEWED